MARGTLKWFNRVSDYGFIACDEDGPDRYVRGENVNGPPSALVTGSRVEYDARQGGMGPEAINVRRLAPIRRRNTGSFEHPRRHGHFDPRFRPRHAASRESIDLEVAATAVHEWESEGGAAAIAR
jgi:CspA family cold shock protein